MRRAILALLIAAAGGGGGGTNGKPVARPTGLGRQYLMSLRPTVIPMLPTRRPIV